MLCQHRMAPQTGGCGHAGRSSWSRANVAGFVRIPDVTDAEARAYLLVRLFSFFFLASHAVAMSNIQ